MKQEVTLCDRCDLPLKDDNCFEVNDDYVCEDCFQGMVAGAEAQCDAIRRGE
jgi:hypothetical protein